MDWGVVYIETRGGKVPAEEFLDACPTKVDARFSAVLEAVRSAPPPFASRDYLKVRKLGNEYLRQFPRRIAQTDL
jgi:hypothetical protein